MTSIPKTEEEWKKVLTPEQYHVLREKGTEAAFTGTLWNKKEKGMYRCAGCGAELFSSDTKFDSGTGWPSFDRAMPGSVRMIPDASHGMMRTEVVCAQCDGHLGHVFEDVPRQSPATAGGLTPTCKRFCINSVALTHKSTP